MHIWPLQLWEVPLFDARVEGGRPKADRGASLLRKVAKIGSKGFERYRTEILPKELEIDPELKHRLDVRDGDPENFAFRRWQKRVYAIARRTIVDEIDWDGRPVPKHPQLSYDWPEFHGGAEVQELVQQIARHCHQFVKSLAREPHEVYPDPKIFAWIEVFHPGEYQLTHVHTGAPVAGIVPLRYAADPESGLSQGVVIEDPRGRAPPFGQTHRVEPVLGEVMLFPAWTPHYFEVNPSNKSNIFLSFIAWPPGGAMDFDWEDDDSAEFVARSIVSVSEKKSGQAAAAQARSDEL